MFKNYVKGSITRIEERINILLTCKGRQKNNNSSFGGQEMCP